jgi:hypothetical protein
MPKYEPVEQHQRDEDRENQYQRYGNPDLIHDEYQISPDTFTLAARPAIKVTNPIRDAQKNKNHEHRHQCPRSHNLLLD